MGRLFNLSWVLLCAVASSEAAAQAVDSTAGRVEVIGLRRWTISMLRDSLRAYRPDVDLGDAACGEVLRDSLGFAEAGVLRFPDGRVVLTVIEPSDSARVVLRPVSGAAVVPRGPWDRLRALQDQGGFTIDYAIDTYLAHTSGQDIPLERGDSALVWSVWSLLEEPSTPMEARDALRVLAHAPDPQLRRAAAGYVVRYPDQPAVWYALVSALRDPDWDVRSAANGALRTLRTHARRQIDWQPAVEDLRHLLNGTTLVYHTEVITLLLATEVSPQLARDLLSRAGVALLLEQQAAQHEYVREPARELLVRLSGRDYGSAAGAWQAWVDSVLGTAP
jgi:hypothetical protein